MDKVKARKVANELPIGTQVLYGDYPEAGNYYSCAFHPDIVYATYGEVTRKLQIICPQQQDTTFPLVVFIQGSAWRKQDIYANIPNLAHIAAKGYTVASVEIRETDLAPFPAALEDVKCAIRFMRKNKATYHVDTKRVAVWGDSSGGHLALMTGLTMGEYTNHLYADESDNVNVVIDYYGVTDLLTLGTYNDILDHDAEDAPEGLLIGGSVKDYPEEAKKASPLHQDLTRELPPILIVHGDCDGVVHIHQSLEMYKALRENDQQAIFYKVIGADHGPGIWNPQVLDVTEKFLQAHLKKPI